jgi:7,8-dihydropterin-6-yl-methyl-4-(beta-D-ribofuranosyl)aminobenzene 5'-phosphate synthase
MVALRVLFDNYSHDDQLETAWGYSCLVGGPEGPVLFDTGSDGHILLGNMRMTGVDPRSIPDVVLSHEHWDHTGGLQALLAAGGAPRVHVPRAFAGAFAEGISAAGGRLVEVDGPAQIRGPVHTSGPMGSAIVEQALVVDCSPGVAVITGCAHPGIVEIVERTVSDRGGPVSLVAGGFHLSSHPRVGEVVERFRQLGVERVGPSHCSGDGTREAFRREYGPAYLRLGAGALVEHVCSD